MIVIHHNPECGTSRNVLKIIQGAGYLPVIVEYVKEGWTRNQLLALFAAANMTPREALSTTISPAQELGLLDKNVTDEALIAAMLEHPVLVNRPIVCSPKGVKLCRPSEAVLDLLDHWPSDPYFKEDGEKILDEKGHRII
ncbi:MAG: arsenate reductase family protein [Aestuariibacter sp.]|uniref:arsenate reductase family protein n=1 Tax=Marisediminitalea aggregata TaxID=634436 RepID=UPI0020CCA214|nr:arsenate reductase family protein [Marisediminitalea aggregata]MCP3863717.1 arsenate reductase family protein [Aestuariibacter sp.]MCP4864380.1 arsenate reductase family protein [Alteromonas sp.]MCP4233716.1 arsenate reductase family protein [Aestuariibacter sp.]MCP4529101.1 arsenate reductase family protein [Aestuariibacter sp.]MCP5013525.1 arsenate reductase family protein [Aestuariibacter sp.]|tara:strand:+ start:2580 stop:2999 length:420 start_codon:yes stop_codon:yes gene_type:complete